MLKLKAFLAAALALCLVLAGCGPGQEEVSPPPVPAPSPVVTPVPETPPPEPPKKKVGISLPDQDIWRWERDGSLMRQLFEEKGFVVDLRYADYDVDFQISQLEEMIESGCDVLIITGVDPSALTKVLAPAKDKEIPVIAHARLIRLTDAVSYYVTLDYMGAVLAHGKYIEEELDLKNSPGPFNIEIFGGDPSHGNEFSAFSKFFIEYLQTYLDSGKIVIPSGKVGIPETGIDGYKTELAKWRMEVLIDSQGYGPVGKKLDAAICASDSIAQGVTQALLEAGYTEKDFPIITGMDCDPEAVKNIMNGTQVMSLWPNAAKLAGRTFMMTESILNEDEPEINAPHNYDNDVKVVPTYVCEFDIVTRENYKELLIDSGYYTQEEIDIIS